MILWDFQIQMDKLVMATQLDIVVVDKQGRATMVIDTSGRRNTRTWRSTKWLREELRKM